jgi:NitT/TauT family transport system ATP-binding protein
MQELRKADVDRMMIPAASLEAVGVSKIFSSQSEDSVAVDNVSLTVAPGEFVSLIGPSGCGKSTMMLMAGGLVPPTQGEMRVNGKVLTQPLTDIGIVFQDHLLLDFRTSLNNVMLQAEIRRLPLPPMREKAMALLEQLGVAGSAGKYPKQMSGGMRQRVSIARALVHEPTMLMMDEPFGALDAISRTQIRHDLELLWMKTRKTVLFITHSIEEAIGLSDRVIIMSPSPGRIVKEIKIDLPRPRPAHLGDYPSFNLYAEEINDAFRQMGVIAF